MVRKNERISSPPLHTQPSSFSSAERGTCLPSLVISQVFCNAHLLLIGILNVYIFLGYILKDFAVLGFNDTNCYLLTFKVMGVLGKQIWH